MTQRVEMDLFIDIRTLDSLLARVSGIFRIDGLITVVATGAWKQPDAGFSRQAAPVLAQLLDQFWAEQHIAISAVLAALDVNHLG